MPVEMTEQKYVEGGYGRFSEVAQWERHCRRENLPVVVLIPASNRYHRIEVDACHLSRGKPFMRGRVRARVKWLLLTSRFSSMSLDGARAFLSGVPACESERLAGWLFDALTVGVLPPEVKRVVEWWGDEGDTDE